MSDDEREEMSARIDALLMVAALAIDLSGRNIEGAARLRQLEEDARRLNWHSATLEALAKVRAVLLLPPDAKS